MAQKTAQDLVNFILNTNDEIHEGIGYITENAITKNVKPRVMAKYKKVWKMMENLPEDDDEEMVEILIDCCKKLHEVYNHLHDVIVQFQVMNEDVEEEGEGEETDSDEEIEIEGEEVTDEESEGEDEDEGEGEVD